MRFGATGASPPAREPIAYGLRRMGDAAVGAATPGRGADFRAQARSSGAPRRRRVHRHRAGARASSHLQRRSFWQDEGFTWSTVDRSFPALLSVMVRHEGYQILHALIEWPTNRDLEHRRRRCGCRRCSRSRRPCPRCGSPGDASSTSGPASSPRCSSRSTAACSRTRRRRAATCSRRTARGVRGRAPRAVRARAAALEPRRLDRVQRADDLRARVRGARASPRRSSRCWFLPAARRRELHWIRDGALIALLAAPAILAPVYQINSGEIAFITKPGRARDRGLRAGSCPAAR